MKRISILAVVLLAGLHPAHAQTSRPAAETRGAETKSAETKAAETKAAEAKAAEAKIFESQIFEQLNQEREKTGLPALEWNDQAARAARIHARAMVENGKLSHQ